MRDEEGSTFYIITDQTEIRDLIAEQTLKSSGYPVFSFLDIDSAMGEILKQPPDCIIVDTNLPGLSAKDLMVMMQAQGIDVPAIVLARKGEEADVIQAFRLGAEDYILWPCQETEVLAVVERVLGRVNSLKQRERMERQIQRANAELQQRIREMTTIYKIGKVVTSITDISLLSEKILDAAIEVTSSEIGWLMLRDEATKVFFLVAHRNLPPLYANRLHKPWDDGISVLAARSGKMLFLYGENLTRFEVSKFGKSILIVPIKSQQQVIGLMIVMHAQPTPFNQNVIRLLEAVADYASISLQNARMFLAVEERLRSMNRAEDAHMREQINLDMLRNFSKEQASIIEETMDTLESLSKIPASRWSAKQRDSLLRLRDQVESLIHLAETSANISDSSMQS